MYQQRETRFRYAQDFSHSRMEDDPFVQVVSDKTIRDATRIIMSFATDPLRAGKARAIVKEGRDVAANMLVPFKSHLFEALFDIVDQVVSRHKNPKTEQPRMPYDDEEKELWYKEVSEEFKQKYHDEVFIRQSLITQMEQAMSKN